MDLDKVFEKIPYEKLYPLPNWQRFAAVGGVAVLLLVIFYFLVIRGQDETIVQLEQDLAKVQKEVEDNRAHASKLNKLKEKITKLEADRAEAAKQLPSEKEIPELLEQVSNLGTQSQLEFLTFKPQPEQMREFYAEVPVSIEVTGKFHNILMFFDEIAHLPRIVTIGDMKMQTVATGAKQAAPAAKQQAQQQGTKIQLSCMATTYRFLEGAVGAKDGDKGKAAPGTAPGAVPAPGAPPAPPAAPASAEGGKK
ncbi:MAG: type 4a pilus biogenesis protein PilO [Nitrospinae bacterium]|nr:type 4a pilus biogenesis protein PilO [Nitrospinota bacterium]